jgi:flagellin
MSFRINTNIASINAQRNLSVSESAVSRSMAKLSSGFRISRAADDAAGLAIANKLAGEGRALGQALRNTEQANAMLQIAEGGASSIQKMLERMKELAAQAASDNVDSTARTQLNNEFTALRAEIGRTANTTKFQTTGLLNGGLGASVNTSSTVFATTSGAYDVRLNGAAAGSYTLWAGGGGVTLSNGSSSQTMAMTAATKQTLNFSQFGISIDTTSAVGAATLNSLNITVAAGTGTYLVGSSGDYAGQDTITLNPINLTTGAAALNLDAASLTSLTNAQSALGAIDTAINSVGTALGAIGSSQNRLEYAETNLRSRIQNFAAAESTIRDADMADEMANFTKHNILVQAGTAMLAQANQSGQSVLQLLRG